MRAARVREHIRSNVIGYVCLAWLMTGTAVAATHLPAGSVGTRQLRRGAVTADKVKRNTLTGAQIRESGLGTVPRATNALTLGGLAPGAFQRRVGGTCAGRSAVRAVNGDGTVACQPTGTITKVSPGAGLTGGGDAGDVTIAADTNVLQQRVTGGCAAGITDVRADGSVACSRGSISGLSQTVAINHGLNFGNFGDLSIGYSCGGSNDRFLRIVLINESGGPATLNWIFHDGSTLQVSGASLGTAQNDHAALADSSNGRIEGQFILAGPQSVTTLNVHAFRSLGSGCEISGTTVKSTL